MKQYKELIQDILKNGEVAEDRTGIGTYSLFGTQLRFDLTKGFPATTTKKLAWKSVVSELLWFLSGSTNVNDLREILHGSRTQGKTIWDDNYNNQARMLGYDNGDLGPIYGKQFRDFNGVDQLAELIEGVKKDIETGSRSRRHIISLWNPRDLDDQSLPCCHILINVKVHKDKGISLSWYQR